MRALLLNYIFLSTKTVCSKIFTHFSYLPITFWSYLSKLEIHNLYTFSHKWTDFLNFFGSDKYSIFFLLYCFILYSTTFWYIFMLISQKTWRQRIRILHSLYLRILRSLLSHHNAEAKFCRRLTYFQAGLYACHIRLVWQRGSSQTKRKLTMRMKSYQVSDEKAQAGLKESVKIMVLKHRMVLLM